MTGAQIIIRKLKEKGIDKIFEFPGGSICPILDELYKQKKIKVYCFRHEQAAIHAADAYARLRREASVCMATSGPGASNLVTGIANAYMDSVPLVVITGQVAVWDLKKTPVRQRGFQELDIISVVKSITKAAFLVNHVSDLAKTLDKAFFIAQSQRPGPVLVDIPINLQYTSTGIRKPTPVLKEKGPKASISAVKEIAAKLKRSKRPLFITGGGVILSGASRELSSLVKKHNLPVCATLMGLTSVPSEYKFNLGLLGYAGTRTAHMAVKKADFILGLGTRFDNRALPLAKKEFSGSAFIAHVDCDKNELNHRVRVNKAVLSDAGFFISGLAKELQKNKFSNNRKWLEQIAAWKNEYTQNNTDKLKPEFIINELSQMLRDKKAVITTDVGQHQLWTAQFFKFRRPHSFITSGGLGTMGFGLPAAIGAKLADPEACVINITSDGSFQMNIQELATIKDLGLAVKIIILNNKCLGLVRQIQEYAFCGRYASTCVNKKVNFLKIASGYGIDCFSVNKEEDVIPALKRIVSSNNSLLAEFMIGELENVFPARIKGKVIYK